MSLPAEQFVKPADGFGGALGKDTQAGKEGY